MLDKGPMGLAKVEYLDGEVRVIRAGTYVLCAISGRQIPLDDLRYWNIDRQEAYFGPEEAKQRFLDTRKG